MLHGLFGNKSIEKIFLFLLVHEKTYANQLHRFLNTSLTPIQKGLEKLEREGILKSLIEGKTKYYAFDPRYPLMGELESLLKKAYTLLSPEEKRVYYSIRTSSPKKSIAKTAVENVWATLAQLSRISFTYRARGALQGQGKGKVSITTDGEGRLIFQEKGAWQSAEGQEFLFHNAFRWTLGKKQELISVEHLRHGINHPVFLFHLVPRENNCLESAQAHLCGQDTYFGRLVFSPSQIILTWRTLGPRKNEEMAYTYF